MGIRIQDPMFFNLITGCCSRLCFPGAHLQLLAHGVEGVPLLHETPQQVRDLPRDWLWRMPPASQMVKLETF